MFRTAKLVCTIHRISGRNLYKFTIDYREGDGSTESAVGLESACVQFDLPKMYDLKYKLSIIHERQFSVHCTII